MWRLLKKKIPFTYYCLLALIVLLWGLAWPINKKGLFFTSPFNYIELRLIFATFTFFLIVFFTKNLIFPKNKDWPLILITGLFQLMLPLLLGTYGLSLLGAGEASFLVFTTSIWLVPLSACLHKKINLIEITSIALGVLGVVLLLQAPEKAIPLAQQWVGYTVLLAASLFWSIGILCSRHMKWHSPPLQLLPWQLLLATLLALIFAHAKGIPLLPRSFDPILLYTLLYTGCISLGIGYWSMIFLSKALNPSIVSLGLILVPVVSLLGSWLFLGEKITLTFSLGCLSIIAGVLFHIYSEKKYPKEQKIYKDIP